MNDLVLKLQALIDELDAHPARSFTTNDFAINVVGTALFNPWLLFW